MLFRATAMLTLLLLAGNGLASSVAFLCRMTGEVSITCCCDDAGAPESDELRADAKCCDVLRAGIDLPEATTPERVLMPAPLVVALPEPLDLFSYDTRWNGSWADAPDPPEPDRPLFTLHCSLLI